jgi:hypothetical protein
MGADSNELPDEIEYEGAIPAQEKVRAQAEVIWKQAWASDPALRATVRAEQPNGEAPPLPVSLDVTQGADPLSVTLIVMLMPTLASIGKTVVLDIWHKILLPKLERTWGEGSLREVGRHRRRGRQE